MNELTLTAKIQIHPNMEHSALFIQTMHAYRNACNFLANQIFLSHDLNQASVNRDFYSVLRSDFGLKAQMAQSVIKTVIARYKSILETQKEWILPVFKKPQLDLVWNRDYSLTKNYFSVNTLNGRVKVPFDKKGMEQYFESPEYHFGTAKLIFKHNKYFLHIPVTFAIPDTNIHTISNIVGIDRGINFIITAYDSKGKTSFVSGKQVKHIHAHYMALRKELQMVGTPSSRRRLKEIGQRENRFMQDVNHCVSKALVNAYPKETLFVLEDLTGITDSVKERVMTKTGRSLLVSWSFYDLEQKLTYKAAKKGQTVIKVDPAYTSQCCPKCGHTEKGNRDKKMHLFTCKTCGYRSNDDRIGAMNLYDKGRIYVNTHTVPHTVTAE